MTAKSEIARTVRSMHAAIETNARRAPPDGKRIVSMVEHNGRLVLATERNVYELRDGEWHLIKFAPPQQQE